MMTLKQIYQQVDQLSYSELETLNQYVQARRKRIVWDVPADNLAEIQKIVNYHPLKTGGLPLNLTNHSSQVRGLAIFRLHRDD